MESKGYSLAVHYRQSTRKNEVRQRIVTAARKLTNVRIIRGKQVINLVPVGAHNKGTALAAERNRLGCEWVLYVGDDENDEDAFADENDEDAFAMDVNLVAVRVGFNASSRTCYYLRQQPEIDRLLHLLVKLREGVISKGRETMS